MQNISAPNSQSQNVEGVVDDDDDDDDTVLAEDDDDVVNPTPPAATHAAFVTTSKTNGEIFRDQQVIVKCVLDEDQKTVSSQGMEVVNGVDKGQHHRLGSNSTKSSIVEAESSTNVRAGCDVMLGTAAATKNEEVKDEETTLTEPEPEPEPKQRMMDENETKEQEDRCGGIPCDYNDGPLSGPEGQQHSLSPRPLNGEIAGRPQKTMAGQSGRSIRKPATKGIGKREVSNDVGVESPPLGCSSTSTPIRVCFTGILEAAASNFGLLAVVLTQESSIDTTT